MIVGMMGAVFVDDERSTAWIGTWHELGPGENAEAVGRALFERVSDALLLSCLAQTDTRRPTTAGVVSSSDTTTSSTSSITSSSHVTTECECVTIPATLFVGVGLPKDSAAEALVRAAGYQLVEDAEGAGRSGWDGLTWTGIHDLCSYLLAFVLHSTHDCKRTFVETMEG